MPSLAQPFSVPLAEPASSILVPILLLLVLALASGVLLHVSPQVLWSLTFASLLLT